MTVELSIPPLPVHVRTARIVVVAAARRAGLSDAHVDELRLAIGEACARAVALHVRYAQHVPVRLRVHELDRSFSVDVLDMGPPPERFVGDVGVLLQESPADPDVALAFLAGLVEDLSVTSSERGTKVRLRWPLPAEVSETAGV